MYRPPNHGCEHSLSINFLGDLDLKWLSGERDQLQLQGFLSKSTNSTTQYRRNRRCNGRRQGSYSNALEPLGKVMARVQPVR
jgi:hypothetical protein